MAVSSRTADALRLWRCIPAEEWLVNENELDYYSPNWRSNTT
jgi:hypothetical protein